MIDRVALSLQSTHHRSITCTPRLDRRRQHPTTHDISAGPGCAITKMREYELMRPDKKRSAFGKVTHRWQERPRDGAMSGLALEVGPDARGMEVTHGRVAHTRQTFSKTTQDLSSMHDAPTWDWKMQRKTRERKEEDNTRWIIGWGRIPRRCIARYADLTRTKKRRWRQTVTQIGRSPVRSCGAVG